MLNLMLLLASAAPPPAAPAPALSSPVVSMSNAGTCPGPVSSATFHFGWTETSVDRDVHRVEVYKAGVLLTSSAASTGYDEVITGWTITGPTGRMTFTREYSAKLVRISDGVVLSTVAPAAYAVDLGTC